MKPLAGKKIISLAVNLPGPLAAMRLQQLGAKIIKIEPPTGDPIKEVAPEFYSHMSRGQKIMTLDLKTPGEQKKLFSLLKGAHLLITSSRPRSLEKLSLGWKSLHKRFPQLHQVAIVGFPSPHQDKPGHDLTYQAQMGFIRPPHLPQTCLADIAGTQEAVIQALTLFTEKKGSYSEVSLARSLELFGLPLQKGLTGHGKILGGNLPGYNLYETKKGWIAVAVLEPQFYHRLSSQLKLDKLDHERLKLVFLGKTAQEWERWANEHDLPLVEVQ